uniref:Uncharacterized protein n=1 Tax=viral metagenome TaxID=1070528 RepID=A0A6C0JEH3_9ZZZZ
MVQTDSKCIESGEKIASDMKVCARYSGVTKVITSEDKNKPQTKNQDEEENIDMKVKDEHEINKNDENEDRTSGDEESTVRYNENSNIQKKTKKIKEPIFMINYFNIKNIQF